MTTPILWLVVGFCTPLFSLAMYLDWRGERARWKRLEALDRLNCALTQRPYRIGAYNDAYNLDADIKASVRYWLPKIILVILICLIAEIIGMSTSHAAEILRIQDPRGQTMVLDTTTAPCDKATSFDAIRVTFQGEPDIGCFDRRYTYVNNPQTPGLFFAKIHWYVKGKYGYADYERDESYDSYHIYVTQAGAQLLRAQQNAQARQRLNSR